MQNYKTSDVSWYYLEDVRKKKIANSVWIPLRRCESLEYGDINREGFWSIFSGTGSLAVPLTRRDEGEHLTWMDIGLAHFQRPYAFDNSYKSVDCFQQSDEDDLGIELVLVQSFCDNVFPEWHLNQDIIFALDLRREGDVWIRPEEDYIDVVRLKRNELGKCIELQMRADHLKDYLCARRMSLRVSTYFSRCAIFKEELHFKNVQGFPYRAELDGGRFELRRSKVNAEGMPVGAETMIMHVKRTDFSLSEDVPVLGPETDDNVVVSTILKRAVGDVLYRYEGEFWRDEWLEPAPQSPRVKNDKVLSNCFFYIDADGTKESSDSLNSEDVGRWLWFKPEVALALLDRRGVTLKWYTRNTGAISPTPGFSVHFGINELGLINVYAFDIAKLPEWLRRFWVGYNVPPEGGVCSELIAAQVEATPAETHACETHFKEALEALDEVFIQRWGRPLFLPHNDVKQIIGKVLRFRACINDGILSLAKDIARLTVDRIDIKFLKEVSTSSVEEGSRSIKVLGRVLEGFGPPEDVRRLLSPLVGVYELRLGDAHLASSKIGEAYYLVGIDSSASNLEKAFQMIDRVSSCLDNITDFISKIDS